MNGEVTTAPSNDLMISPSWSAIICQAGPSLCQLSFFTAVVRDLDQKAYAKAQDKLPTNMERAGAYDMSCRISSMMKSSLCGIDNARHIRQEIPQLMSYSNDVTG